MSANRALYLLLYTMTEGEDMNSMLGAIAPHSTALHSSSYTDVSSSQLSCNIIVLLLLI